MSRHALVLLLTFATSAFVSCDRQASDSPVAPTPPPLPASAFGTGPTRIIRIDGPVSFGDREVGGHPAVKEFEVCNDGNAALTVRDVIGPVGYSFTFPSYWDFGYEEIAAARCVRFSVAFTPLTLGPSGGTVTLQANHTSGSPTFHVSGTVTMPPTPRTVFGEGRYLVGIGVAPGRYFSNPGLECYWHRSPNPPPVPGKDITWMSSSFDPDQWVVDILPSDAAFETSNQCGEWSQSPAPVRDPNVITAGIWLVREQVPQGRYRANARPGCSWARLRNFEGTMDAVSVIESGFDQAGEITVTIRSTDVGFEANDACGKWTRVS